MIENLLTPYKTTQKKIRLGPNSDSGYVVLEKPFHNCEYFFSFGVGGNIDFEKEIIKKYNLKCHCFDGEPYYENFPELLEIPYGESKEISDNLIYHKSHITKDNINQILPHESNFILKMDIEGGEWDVFNYIDSEKSKNMTMLIVELHLNNELYRTRSFETLYKSLSKLNESHRLIHIHGNNHEGFMQHTKGIPNVVECCYVLRTSDLYENQIDFDDYPVSGIDFPCKSDLPDLVLNFWK